MKAVKYKMTDKPKLFHLVSANKRCHSNSIDSARLLRYLAANGLEAARDPADADFILVNSCGSIRETREFSGNLLSALLKARRPGARLFCAGCLGKMDALSDAAPEGTELLRSFSDLDAVIGARFPFESFKEAYYEDSLYGGLGGDPVPLAPALSFAAGALAGILGKFAGPRFVQRADAVRHANKAHVQIGSGCLGACSYCAIKLARGGPRSRPAADIVADARRVWRKGLVLNLVADDCGSYGQDTGTDIFSLTAELAATLPEAPLDLRYLNPVWLERQPEHYLKMFRLRRINSVNVCLQSGSDRVLKLMNRGYSAAKVLAVVDELKAVSPGTLLRSHFIAGFPTETWSDFSATLRAARRFHFHNTYAYSANKGTPAYGLPDDVPPAVKALRRGLLQLQAAASFFSR